MPKPFIISVEGNIGSGKSTLLRYLSEEIQQHDEKNNWVFLQEPVDDWATIQDEHGTTMLEKFYGDQKKYAFSFQIMAYISRLAILKKAVDENPGAIIVTERSLYTDKHVFAKMLYDVGNIEEVDYQIYQRWFDTFVEDYPISGYVYVKTEPEICHQRVNKRSRDGEDSIALDYLNSCHEYHEDMMRHQEPVLALDGNQEFDQEKANWRTQTVAWASRLHSYHHDVEYGAIVSPHTLSTSPKAWAEMPFR